MRTPFLATSLFLFVGCSSGDATSVAGADSSVTDGTADGVVADSSALDSAFGDAPTTDSAKGDSTTPDIGKDGTTDTGTPPTDAGTCTKGAACGVDGVACLCCPAGGPTERCTCTTECTTDVDCKDAAHPVCNHSPGMKGICTTKEFICCWLCK